MLAVVLCTQQLQAQKAIQWLTFEEALKQNAVAPKLILIDLYTEWCGWCKVMDRTTLVDPVIVDYMVKNFYAVRFDAEGSEPVKFFGRVNRYDSLRKENVVVMDTIVFKQMESQQPGRKGTHQLAIALTDGKLSYPTYVILDPNLQRLDMIAGANDAAAFETMLNFFGQGAYKTTSYDDFAKTYKPTATATIRSKTPQAPPVEKSPETPAPIKQATAPKAPVAKKATTVKKPATGSTTKTTKPKTATPVAPKKVTPAKTGN